MAIGTFGMYKKGVVFTIMSIVVASVLILAAQSQTSSYLSEQSKVAATHIKATNGIVLAFKSFAKSALRSTTFAALENMSVILAAQSDPEKILYYEDFDAFVDAARQCVLYSQTAFSAQGTGGTPITASDPCLEQGLIPLLNNFTALVNDSLNVDVLYVIDNASFSLSEELPFEAIVSLTLNITVIDSFANWTQTDVTLEAFVPLFGLSDPVTSKFAADSTYSQPNFAAYSFYATDITSWNSSTILEFIGAEEFRLSTAGPSIFGRYYGNFSPSSCCGMETIVNGTKLISTEWNTAYSGVNFLGVSSNYSFVDYDVFASTDTVNFEPKLFFCNAGTERTNKMDNGIFDSRDTFWLNQSILSAYGISGSDWVGC